MVWTEVLRVRNIMKMSKSLKFLVIRKTSEKEKAMKEEVGEEQEEVSMRQTKESDQKLLLWMDRSNKNVEIQARTFGKEKENILLLHRPRLRMTAYAH